MEEIRRDTRQSLGEIEGLVGQMERLDLVYASQGKVLALACYDDAVVAAEIHGRALRGSREESADAQAAVYGTTGMSMTTTTARRALPVVS